MAFSLHDLLKNCYRRHYTHESLKRNKNQKMLGVFTKVKNAYVKVFQVRNVKRVSILLIMLASSSKLRDLMSLHLFGL